MKRIPSLDGFRAISIILVVISHSRFSYGFPFKHSELLLSQIGSLGVTVFFVISGFLITNLLLAEQVKDGSINVRYFYVRRVFRIIPVYALYVFFVMSFKNIDHLKITNNNLLHFLTFTSNFDWNLPLVFQHLWSLSVEEQFYLIWPAILVIFRRRLNTVILFFIICSCVSRVISHKFPGHDVITLSQFFNFSDSIFIGALGGILFLKNKNISKLNIFNSYFLQAFMIFLIVLFKYLPGQGEFAIIALPFGVTFISFAILFLIFAYINPSDKIIFKILNNKAVVHIGILSYSIYVWQQFFFVGEIRGLWRTFPYNILFIYLTALVSYYFWEKPFLNLKKYFTGDRLKPASHL